MTRAGQLRLRHLNCNHLAAICVHIARTCTHTRPPPTPRDTRGRGQTRRPRARRARQERRHFSVRGDEAAGHGLREALRAAPLPQLVSHDGCASGVRDSASSVVGALSLSAARGVRRPSWSGCQIDLRSVRALGLRR